jgi:hypothetical protein
MLLATPAPHIQLLVSQLIYKKMSFLAIVYKRRLLIACAGDWWLCAHFDFAAVGARALERSRLSRCWYHTHFPFSFFFSLFFARVSLHEDMVTLFTRACLQSL